MAATIEILLKQPDGTRKPYTINIYDKVDKFGNNVAMFEKQTQAEREANAPKSYLGNGRVIWTNGMIDTSKKLQGFDSASNEEKKPEPLPPTNIIEIDRMDNIDPPDDLPF